MTDVKEATDAKETTNIEERGILISYYFEGEKKIWKISLCKEGVPKHSLTFTTEQNAYGFLRRVDNMWLLPPDDVEIESPSNNEEIAQS